jgi:hypothetical protein
MADNSNVSEYLQKILKLIPAEVVILYTTVLAIVGVNITGQFVVAGICLALVPLYLLFATGVKNTRQIIISTIAFAIYVFASGGPFIAMPWYQPWIPATILAIFTGVVPMFASSSSQVMATASRSKSWREV